MTDDLIKDMVMFTVSTMKDLLPEGMENDVDVSVENGRVTLKLKACTKEVIGPTEINYVGTHPKAWINMIGSRLSRLSKKFEKSAEMHEPPRCMGGPNRSVVVG